MTNNKLLKLPSQRQLVDRLLHLIEFNHPFIFLSGKPGSGRGTLCESLLAQLPDQVRVVSLIGSPAMKMADVRQLLLQQVVARPLFNAQDALADSFFRMLEGKPSTLLLMIERADTLPTELVGELWALGRHNDTLASPHKLAILLSGSDVWCRDQKNALKGRAMPALELEVAPLSAPEQRIFLYEKAKELKIPAALLPKPKVEENPEGGGGHPSAIMQSLEDVMTDRRPKKRQAELPVKKIATVLALAAAGLLALSYLPLFEEAGKGETLASSQGMALPNPVATDPLSIGTASGSQSTQGGGTTSGEQGGQQVARDWQPDAKTLPKKVESETVTTESSNSRGATCRHLRRSGRKADDAAQHQRRPADGGGGRADWRSSRAVPTVETAQPKTQNSAPVAKATPTPAAAAPAAAPAPKVALTPAATLNKKARNHYSIQLMGASNTQAVDSFVAEHGLAGKVWVYKTRFRGSPWYVVVQGDYANSTQAKAAIRKLTPALLKGQPWPKSFAQIQKELKQ